MLDEEVAVAIAVDGDLGERVQAPAALEERRGEVGGGGDKRDLAGGAHSGEGVVGDLRLARARLALAEGDLDAGGSCVDGVWLALRLFKEG